MEVILSKQCLSLTGMLERGTGYFLQARRNKKGHVRFFSQRSKYLVPPDGHWRFIVLCAELAQNKLHITDIRVRWDELQSALYEAKCFVASEQVWRNYDDKGKTNYDARDILNLKTTFGL